MFGRLGGALAVCGCLCVAAVTQTPRIVDVPLGDPRFSRPHKPSTICYGLLLVVLLCIYTFVGTLFYRHRKVERPAYQMFLLGAVVANTLGVVLTENIKNIVGGPRPDFHERFRRDELGNYLHSARTMADARKSFPSGHTSAAFCALSYLLYLYYTVYARPASCAILAAVSAALCTSVGITRVLDNKHFTHDVVCGALLGLASTLVVVCIMRSNIKNWLKRRF
ncbi:diacylglycerol diphosphate phosphatase / phosphatidate phosphatase [Pancytospora philotis]|nr:diacylglycerol diphosphate phosphatase / phosphatidate phosphatase [Pancytospora philotis]